MPRHDKKSMGSKLSTLGETKLSALGQGAKSTGMAGLIVMLLFVAFVIFSNFHALYLKTGTPMLKYGLAMTFLQPFYTMWATWQLTSKYVLRN